ncbi:methylmalonyl-CoA mutase subunit beta [Christiangramia forsetii]|uniref:Methylmalonyl-CoA mutase small subunit n=2 Tax=Christiangramia forsetii TaxID=411153 RepID=A0LZJ1_CHRFK|nr:methylmalonyl-CoA mutase subunit beta [Christiangramia forsetii]GGG38407.1 methylmalonyl-CoA mutase [Christiangramia forsetii]CAL65786.1 methylmalonyl-CoA mutase small subunit [Christiangramia forsetii KT0803]
MKQLLFQDFEEVSAKQWKQKIQADLKGADYNEKLVTKTLHGIDIKPFYSSEDVTETLKVSNPAHWNICEKIYVSSADSANEKALEKLQKGTEAIWFILPEKEIDLAKLFNDLPAGLSVYLHLEFLDAEFVQKLNELISEKDFKIFLQTDIIGNLARSGNWYENLQSDHSALETILNNSSNIESVVSIDLGLFQNAGANIPQQLAYSLAQVTEYLNHFEKIEFSEEQRSKFTFQFNISVGSDYFFEISKIRALRWLFATVAKEFNFNTTCHVIAEPTKRTKTLYDYNVNLLRTTTESMSAILGGADSICNMPYDAIYHKNNNFGDRIARNQLLIMRNESYLDKVGNVAEGTYYIESLTRQLAEKALEIFKEIEKGGGFLKELKAGIIQKKIKESAAEEQEKFNNSELVLIGTNKFENPEDRMEEDIELYPFLKKNPRKTLIEPVLEKRLSEEREQKKLAEEKNSQPTPQN